MRSNIPVLVISGDEPSVEFALRELFSLNSPMVVCAVPSTVKHYVVQPCVPVIPIGNKSWEKAVEKARKKKRKPFRV